MIRALNSFFGFAPTLALSRARRDAGLVLSVVAVLAAAVFLSVAMPRLVADTVDSGAREAVAAAGPAADIDIRVDVGSPSPGLSVVSPQGVLDLAGELPGRLPATLARLYPDLYVTVLSPSTSAHAVDSTRRIELQVGMLTPDDASTITVTDGRLPSAPRDGDRPEIDVVLSAAAADAASVGVGDVLEFSQAGAGGVVAVVSGIIAPVDEDSPRWDDLPQVWAPVSADSGVVTMTVLTNVEGLDAAEPVFTSPSTATLRLVPDASAFSSALLTPVREQIGALRLDSSSLRGTAGADLVVRSSFDSALDEYPGRARAATAQMLVLIAGVLGVAAAVVMLLSRLVVARRFAELALERARGASLASIVIRSLLESVLVSALGGALGLAAATAIGATPTGPAVIVLILAVGVLASPVQAAVLVISADRRGRRAAANRGARREVVRRGQARRLVLEGFVVVVAAAALFAVRSRGLLQNRTEGVDPLLAAAPLLMALGVTVIVLRVYPLVVRFASSLGRRSRGVLGTLGAMQAERALGVLPLAALTLAVSLIVSGGLLVETVRSGQVDASWQRIGADARVEAPLTAAEVATVAASPGVHAASGILELPETSASAGAQSTLVTVLAVDPSFGEVLRRASAQSGLGGKHDISALAAPVSDGDALPVLVDSRLAAKVSGDLTLTVDAEGTGRETVEVQVVGSIDSGAEGYNAGPFIYVDRAALGERIDLADDANILLVIGPGAESAVAALDGDVFRRTQWLADQQAQALVSGVGTVMLSATGAVAALALIGLVANVLAGSRARRRSLSLLRTLGMGPRLGWWLALSELAPMVIAALIGGVAAGVGVIIVMAPSFGLETLSGGVAPPALAIAPWVLGAVVAGAVVLGFVALLVEVVVHRRDRLSDVLRVGESL